MIHIIAIGKKHDAWLKDAIERYEKRLRTPFSVSWKLLSHSEQTDAVACREESARLLASVTDQDYVILLDETGHNLTSPALAQKLDSCFTTARPVTVIIGGAYGVDEQLKARADFIWSLSRLVFPHQLVRLILIEQLYRAQSIQNGARYHHQ